MASLPLRLKILLVQEKYTDCCFILDNNTFIPAHKLVLAAASPVFEAMFFGPFAAATRSNSMPPTPDGQEENSANKCKIPPIPIVDVSAKIWRVLMDYVYTDDANWDALTHCDLLELYYCAEKYLLRDLVAMTVERLSKSVNCDCLFLIYDFAIRFKIQPLLDECRALLRDMLERKPNLFFKKVFQVNCDRVIEREEDIDGNLTDEDSPVVKRKPPIPVEFIEDIVFGGSDHENVLGQYHQISQECLNDILLLNYDDANGLFNENLLLFVLKWTKIEWRLQSKKRLPLQKLPLLNFYESFVCHKRTMPLVENLIQFLEDHCQLNAVEMIPTQGWNLLQRVDLKAYRPLIICADEKECHFETHFQVNHLITIKSFIINSRLNSAVLSRLMRYNRQYVYKENVSLEILTVNDPQNAIVTHRQQFNLEAEFNSQCELFLNKCLHFQPDLKYCLRFFWPRTSAMTIEYPRKIYERCQRLLLRNGRQLSAIFIDEGDKIVTDQGDVIASGGILQGIQFMFLN